MVLQTNWEREIAGSLPLLLIHFINEWNGASQLVSMIYEDLAAAYRGRATFLTADLEKDEGLGQRYGVREAPTILFIRHGHIVDCAMGLTPRHVLIDKIEAALGGIHAD